MRVTDLLAEALLKPKQIAPRGAAQPGWGKRLLPRFKTKYGIKYQLHATRGWKKIGRTT